MSNRPCILRDESGVTVIEFGLITPVLMTMMLGVLDLGHGMYTRSQLVGAIQKTARNSTIEGASIGTLDDRVTAAVRKLVPGTTPTFSRKSFRSFTNVKQAEDFTDSGSPGNGICDNGESYEDRNNNGFWDSDITLVGHASAGGARDAVLYEVTVTYNRLLPIGGFIGQSDTMTLKSTTVLRNQPFGQQAAPMARTCP